MRRFVAWIEEVITEHQAEADTASRAARRKLLGVLVGFVMKKSNGRADPQTRQSVAR